MIEKKYKLTEESIRFSGRTLYRIEATKDFGNVKRGDNGGFVELAENLSHVGNAWVYANARVFDDARIFDDAQVCGNAWVGGNAKVFGNAVVSDNARIFDDAKVYGNAEVFDDAWVGGNALMSGNAKVYGNAKVFDDEDYIVFKNWWSSGRYFTWTKSNNMWKVGCFYGTGEELIKKAYRDSEKSGREYERVVKYVESILKEE